MYYNRNIFSYKGVINRLHFTIYNICYNAFAYLIGIVLNNYLSRITSMFLYFLLFAIFILAAFNIKKRTLDILANAKLSWIITVIILLLMMISEVLTEYSKNEYSLISVAQFNIILIVLVYIFGFWLVFTKGKPIADIEKFKVTSTYNKNISAELKEKIKNLIKNIVGLIKLDVFNSLIFITGIYTIIFLSMQVISEGFGYIDIESMSFYIAKWLLFGSAICIFVKTFQENKKSNLLIPFGAIGIIYSPITKLGNFSDMQNFVCFAISSITIFTYFAFLLRKNSR